MTDATGHPYTRLAQELAGWPDLVRRLLADHPAHGAECPGCTTPGGQMTAAPPCSIRTLALTADAHTRRTR